MPLPTPPEALGTSNRRSRRTPSADSNAPAAGLSAACPALVASTSTVPGVPSGRRTIRHGTPPTRRRPSTEGSRLIVRREHPHPGAGARPFF